MAKGLSSSCQPQFRQYDLAAHFQLRQDRAIADPDRAIAAPCKIPVTADVVTGLATFAVGRAINLENDTTAPKVKIREAIASGVEDQVLPDVIAGLDEPEIAQDFVKRDSALLSLAPFFSSIWRHRARAS